MIWLLCFTFYSCSGSAAKKLFTGGISNFGGVLSIYGYNFPYNFPSRYGHSLSSAVSYLLYNKIDFEEEIYGNVMKSYNLQRFMSLSESNKELFDDLYSEDRRNPVHDMLALRSWLSSIGIVRPIVLFSKDRNKQISYEVFLNRNENTKELTEDEKDTEAFNNNPIVLVFDYSSYSYSPAFNLRSKIPHEFSYLAQQQSENQTSVFLILISLAFIIIAYFFY